VGIFQEIGSVFEKLGSAIAGAAKAVASNLWSFVSGLLALIFAGGWWIYYLIMYLANYFKSRVALSTCLKNVLKSDFPSVALDDVRVVEDAVMVPRGRAMTEGHTIYFRDKFSEDNSDDLRDLMHELVHVRQYEACGDCAFAVIYAYYYVNGFFSYEDIPLEIEARDFVSQHFPDFEVRYQAKCKPAYQPVSLTGDWAWLYW
jgi:hypothetical protein